MDGRAMSAQVCVRRCVCRCGTKRRQGSIGR